MKKKSKSISPEKAKFLGASGRHMTYKDIKRKAIALGMPFPDATGCGVFDLINYIDKSDQRPDKSLIDKYDEWVVEQFNSTGIPEDDPIRNSRLRLGFLGEEGEDGIRKIKKVPGMRKPKEKKPPREKDAFNLVKGTKKSYTWSLVQKGLDLDRVTRRVKKKFPDANDKSISLWYRAAKRQIKSER